MSHSSHTAMSQSGQNWLKMLGELRSPLAGLSLKTDSGTETRFKLQVSHD